MKEDLKVLLLTSAASAGIGVVCGLWVSSHFRLPWNSREKKSLCGGNLNVFAEALFFPDSGIQGFGDMKKSERDKLYVGASINSASLLKIAQLLNNATKSLEICMYHLTNNDLAKVIIHAMKRGVQVRILSDWDSEGNPDSKINLCREAGAFVRSRRQPYLMHHKFVIIDDAIVMTGSFNWTLTAATGNQENVVITNHPEITRKFRQEFSKMWKEFEKVHAVTP